MSATYEWDVNEHGGSWQESVGALGHESGLVCGQLHLLYGRQRLANPEPVFSKAMTVFDVDEGEREKLLTNDPIEYYMGYIFRFADANDQDLYEGQGVHGADQIVSWFLTLQRSNKMMFAFD